MDLKVWETVAPHLETLKDMEALDPDALRILAKTPTGIVMGDRICTPESPGCTHEHSDDE